MFWLQTLQDQIFLQPPLPGILTTYQWGFQTSHSPGHLARGLTQHPAHSKEKDKELLISYTVTKPEQWPCDLWQLRPLTSKRHGKTHSCAALCETVWLCLCSWHTNRLTSNASTFCRFQARPCRRPTRCSGHSEWSYSRRETCSYGLSYIF